MDTTYIALIPAYKPENILVDLIGQLRTMGFTVVIVNDGSGPDFMDIFNRCEQFAKVLTLVENSGKGQALKTGLYFIRSHCPQNSIIVTIDADGQHRPEDAFSVCQIADANRLALVLGSRRLKGKIPVRSRIGNTLTRFIYKASTGISVHDGAEQICHSGRHWSWMERSPLQKMRRSEKQDRVILVLQSGL